LNSIDCRPPARIAEDIANTIGVRKAESSILNLLLLGIMAGAYIAFGAQLATMATHDASAYVGSGLARLIGGGVFSVGLMLVMMAGAELFTGNTLIMLSVLDRKVSVRGLLRNWGIVYLANFIGSVLVVMLVFWSGLWKTDNEAVGIAAMNTANVKVNLTFLEAFARGILCNWLVCLAVWLALAARTVIGKIAACFFPVMAFVASGFEHSVANMYFIPMGLMLKGKDLIVASSHLSISGMTVRNLIPVTLGNIIGGALFVATLYWVIYLRKGHSEG
jgi:formate transporter